MKKDIEMTEREIIGRWISTVEGVKEDQNCERVGWLIANRLIEIVNSKEGGMWEVLYFDPQNKQYWERVYLESSRHGGGPRSLIWISEEDAKKKYEI